MTGRPTRLTWHMELIKAKKKRNGKQQTSETNNKWQQQADIISFIRLPCKNSFETNRLYFYEFGML